LQLPSLLRELRGRKALVVASSDRLYDQYAQRMWAELLKVPWTCTQSDLRSKIQ